MSTDGFPHMDAYISAGSKYRKRLSIEVSGESGSMNQIILETWCRRPVIEYLRDLIVKFRGEERENKV